MNSKEVDLMLSHSSQKPEWDNSMHSYDDMSSKWHDWFIQNKCESCSQAHTQETSEY